VGWIASPASLSAAERDFRLCLADVSRGFSDRARRKASIAPAEEIYLKLLKALMSGRCVIRYRSDGSGRHQVVLGQ
jgi:hypothetical protein